MLQAVVMASGFAKRMGENKLLLPLQGKPVVSYLLRTLQTLPFEKVFVVSSHPQVLQLARNYNHTPVVNTAPQKGQSHSIVLGVQSCSSNADYMFFVADQPFLKPDTITALLTNFWQDPAKIVFPTLNGEKCNPTIFPNRFKKDLLSLSGDSGGKAILQKYPHLINTVAINSPSCFFDIDTPEDYEAARNIAVSALQNQ